MSRPSRRKLFQPLRLHLDEDTGLAGVELFSELAAQLGKLARTGVSAGDSRMAQLKRDLLAHVSDGGPLQLALRDTASARAALALWRENEAFHRHAPLNKAHFRLLREQFNPPSRIVLWQLSQLYLERYDSLPALDELSAYLRQSFNDLPPRQGESREIHAYREQSAWLFAAQAPEQLAKRARRQPLPSLLRRYALPVSGRFAEWAKQARYLHPLAKLKPGADHALFAELRDATVSGLPMEDGLLLGHQVAKLLMDKIISAKVELPDNWRYLLLDIMGDPRVPRAAPSFQTWWGRLEPRYVQAMRAWLSSLDLKLFLNILEEVARSNQRSDLLRMYPARKRFLEGLQQQGLISSSRLLLGKQAENYVRDNFDARDMSALGSLGSAATSLIYLNLGGIHFLEGTHAFQVRLYQEAPFPGLVDYEESRFSLASIRKRPATASVKHSHSPLPRWQHTLIQTLAAPPFRLRVEPRRVLSAEDYANYPKLSA